MRRCTAAVVAAVDRSAVADAPTAAGAAAAAAARAGVAVEAAAAAAIAVACWGIAALLQGTDHYTLRLAVRRENVASACKLQIAPIRKEHTSFARKKKQSACSPERRSLYCSRVITSHTRVLQTRQRNVWSSRLLRTYSSDWNLRVERQKTLPSASPEAGLLVKAPKSSSPPPASSAAIGSSADVLSAACTPRCSVHQ